MKQIRVERPKHRRDRADDIFPRDPRDLDIVRAKALVRAVRRPSAKSSEA